MVGNLVVFYFLYRNAVQTDKLHQAIDKLASGETSYKVDVSQFSSLEAQLAEGLNRISDGLETAVTRADAARMLSAAGTLLRGEKDTGLLGLLKKS